MNQCTFHGRLTREPEIKISANGKEYATFSIAIDRSGKKDEQKITDFIPCIVFDQRAALLKNYFHKGDGIIAMGSLQTNTHTDADGKKTTFYNVFCHNIEFAEKKREDGAAPAPAPADDDELPF